MKARRPTWFRINADPISDPDDLDPEDDSDSRVPTSAENVGDRAGSVGVTGEWNNKELDEFQESGGAGLLHHALFGVLFYLRESLHQGGQWIDTLASDCGEIFLPQIS